MIGTRVASILAVGTTLAATSSSAFTSSYIGPASFVSRPMLDETVAIQAHTQSDGFLKSNRRSSLLHATPASKAVDDELHHEEEEDDAHATASAYAPKVTKITSLEEFLNFLGEDQRLTIIKFHASWCKSCQKFGLRFRKLASQEGDKVDKEGNVMESGRVRFGEIEFTSNAKLCRSLGVKRLPYVHMYRGAEGRLCDFACGPKKFPIVIEKMNEYLGMTKEEVDFARTMTAGDVLGDEILTKMKEEHRRQQEEKLHSQQQFDL